MISQVRRYTAGLLVATALAVGVLSTSVALARQSGGIGGDPVAIPVCGKLLSSTSDDKTKCHLIKGADCSPIAWFNNEYNWRMPVTKNVYEQGVVYVCSEPKQDTGCCTLQGEESQLKCPDSTCAKSMVLE